ncbi:hypothetical protein DAEQUDRAFT_17744 [Daedalea quercina L-15889]|uniref:Conserved oligomeric Golgi complex subunit 1 n=1 Tax=Daedalea quercina L-15889 TaxID=1314783 RepID=A0A165UJZ0_9APHY|nr:hypothetical protein DAEQUDRAFT_17744 [Daedalea quercina L-15889]
MSRIASSSSSVGLSKAGSPEIPNGARVPQGNGTPWPLGRTISGMSTADAVLDPTKNPADIDPDELFTRLNVSEVRKVQQRLRVNAEGKQEELRLMVGERYRDLLQASSSIISMAASSKRVLQALDEMRDVVGSAEPPRMTRRSRVGEEDNHIQALQSLSAHLKLLLDAPEHLWRFMEQRMYLRAAWLFLTARVVHRTLLQEDEDVDHSWHDYGIDVSEQVPLVQRQWDTVSQFRSQITHRATLSLRESHASPGEICATLLTLHILESRPLVETLSIFLTQRSKTLVAALSSSQALANGHVKTASGEHGKPSNRVRKAILREVKRSLQAALDSVSHTLHTAREVFGDASPREVGMMQQALQYIQEEKAPDSLPAELRVTTQTLLSSLPSSAHFSLLPSTIRSYKPYIGAASTSPSVAQDFLQQKLGDWFSHSLEAVRTAASKWFSSLESVKEVWEIRTSSFTSASMLYGLEPHEKTRVRAALDSLCQQQTVSVWRNALDATETSLRGRLASALHSLRGNSNDNISDAQPVDYLFHALPLPSTSQTVINSYLAGAPFKRYKAGLQRQLHGRTPLLHDVLDIIEESSHHLEEDLAAMQASDSEGRALIARLRETYQPDAASLCTRIVEILESFEDDTDKEAMRRMLAFLGRLQYELASSSPFITMIGCNRKAVDEFRKQMHDLHDKTFEHWRELVIDHITANIWPGVGIEDKGRLQRSVEHPRQPTPALIQALLSLSSSLEAFWTTIDPVRKKYLVGNSITYFILRSCRPDIVGPTEPHQGLQHYWDLWFVRHLTASWDIQELRAQLDELIARLREKLLSKGLKDPQLEADNNMSEYLSRVQVIFAPLFPPPEVYLAAPPTNDKSSKPSALLCYAPPAAEQQFQSTLELVKPSARFGLLLVGSPNGR